MHAFRWPRRLTPKSPTSEVFRASDVARALRCSRPDGFNTGNGLPVETMVGQYPTIEN